MYTLSTIVLGLAAIPTIFAAPTPNVLVARQCGTLISGPASAYAAKSTWKTFDAIFNANKGGMTSNGDSASDVTNLKTAVQNVAKSSGIDARVLLAMIIQESHGNVGVECSNGGTDCGIMQVRGSQGFPGQHNLSLQQIQSMVQAGADHFKGDLATYPNIYEALRSYNSGSLDVHKDNLSQITYGTASYVSDISHRLTGSVC